MTLWSAVRIILYIIIGCICGVGIWVFFEVSYTPKLLSQPTPGVLFVRETFDSYVPYTTGSFTFPFITISSAIAAADGPTTLIVEPGTYRECIRPNDTEDRSTCVTLKDDITLYGVGTNADNMPAVMITDDPAELRFPLTTAHNTAVINIHVEGGRDAIVVPYNTHTRLTHVLVSGALEYGILMGGKQNRTQDTERNREAEQYDVFQPQDRNDVAVDIQPHDSTTSLTVTRSMILHNAKQGLYLRDGFVTMRSCLVENNGEEGIDLHPHTKAFITDTVSRKNGESGLETEIYDTDLTVENSTFSENGKNGLAFLTSVGTGTVTLTNLTITDNGTYGIRCARHKNFPRTPRPFFSSVIHTENLTFANNGESNFAPPCTEF